MPLSKVALMCLETSPYFASDLLSWRWDKHLLMEKKVKRSREFLSVYSNLRNNPAEFYGLLKMSLETFDYILEHVGSELESVTTTVRTLGPEEKLFLTLRYLASGMTMKELAISIQVVPCTAAKVVFSTLKVIWKNLSPIHFHDLTHSNMSELAKQYYEKWKFPNCVGSIGGKYVRVFKRDIAVAQRTIYQRKSKVSVVINAVVDANFRFLAVDVISKHNQETEDCFKNVFNDIGMQCLPGTEIMLPLFIIGNEAYPLKSYLMKPYPEKNNLPSLEKKNFNNRLKSARIPVDCAFEILSEKWKIYTRPLVLSLAHVTLIIKVTCLLHNIIKDRDGDRDLHFGKLGQLDTGILYLNLLSHRSRKNNRASAIAMSMRDQLRDYLLDHDT